MKFIIRFLYKKFSQELAMVDNMIKLRKDDLVRLNEEANVCKQLVDDVNKGSRGLSMAYTALTRDIHAFATEFEKTESRMRLSASSFQRIMTDLEGKIVALEDKVAAHLKKVGVNSDKVLVKLDPDGRLKLWEAELKAIRADQATLFKALGLRVKKPANNV